MAVNYKNARLLTLVATAIGALVGVALFVMSVTFLTYPNFVEEYISITKVKAVCAIAIGLGVLIVVSSAVMLASVVLENVNLMKISIGVLVVAFVLNIVCIILAFVMEFKSQEDVNDQIYDLMLKFNQQEFQRETDIWDTFQKRMECCGSDGPKDWKFLPFYEKGNPNQLIPRSCCKAYATTEPLEPSCQMMQDESLYYTFGCRDAVNRLTWVFCGIIVACLGISSVCEIVGSISAWMLVKELSKDDEPYEFSPPPSTAPRLNNYGGGTMKSQNSQSTGYGHMHPHKNHFGAPVSETGSVTRSDDGRRANVAASNDLRGNNEFRQPPLPPHGQSEIHYRPQLPPPPLPPAAAAAKSPDEQDNEDFDV